MKYSDLPQFTNVGDYQTSISWDYLEYCLNKWQTDKLAKLELNPDFQRGHVWSKEQQIKFVEYKLSGGPGANIIYFNCVGWMNNYKGPFILVDGLQRITAILSFLHDEIPAYGYYLHDFDQPLRFIKSNLLFNINNLKTRKEVLTWYIQMNSGGIAHTEEEIERVRKLLLIET